MPIERLFRRSNQNVNRKREKMPVNMSSEEVKRKMQYLISEGTKTLSEIDTLKEALSDTVAAIAEEFDIKKAVLMRAIRTNYKQSLADDKEKMEEVESILESSGQI